MSDDDSLLARWSRRKALARSGTLPADPPVVPPLVPLGGQGKAGPPQTLASQSAAYGPSPSPAGAEGSDAKPAPPLPTLADVADLSHDSDFSRFVMPGVDATVKNAAMKKLFSDPHFNVMDGLDIYIDDYGKPDPIPDAMLRRMTQSKVMRLFDEEVSPPEAVASIAPPEASPDGVAAPPLPQSNARASGDDHPDPNDEDTAVRLQPDDAAGPTGAGPDCEGARP